jgi:hypothetical protein
VETEDQLRDALRRSMQGVDPPVHELVSAVLRERPRRPRVGVWAAGAAGAAAAAAAVVAVLAVISPWGDRGDQVPSGGPADRPSARSSGCDRAHEGVLPTWARMGFSDPEPVAVHVVSDHGRIVAILFGRVLHAPPAEQVNNKILWVARTRGADPLRIEAVLDGSGRTVHREVTGGPGPSTVDLPEAGCWHLTLAWGTTPDRRDTIDLRYVDAPADEG